MVASTISTHPCCPLNAITIIWTFKIPHQSILLEIKGGAANV